MGNMLYDTIQMQLGRLRINYLPCDLRVFDELPDMPDTMPERFNTFLAGLAWYTRPRRGTPQPLLLSDARASLWRMATMRDPHMVHFPSLRAFLERMAACPRDLLRHPFVREKRAQLYPKGEGAVFPEDYETELANPDAVDGWTCTVCCTAEFTANGLYVHLNCMHIFCHSCLWQIIPTRALCPSCTVPWSNSEPSGV